jgi:ATP-dependent DNA helicase RecQ
MPPTGVDASSAPAPEVLETIRRIWGFDRLRPLQGDAIRAALSGRDSLVVLPTGGGKSLCYQVPPVVAGRTDLVVSPLISLMKDQVDGLRANGYPAAAVHSGLDPAQRDHVLREAAAGAYRLLFVSPERLATSSFRALLSGLGVRAIAIDEAHCISHWGHDFRPEYRQLAALKEILPGVSVHAYTATATPRVRQDIAEQLRLADPRVLVGHFDRPNLTYRIRPRVNLKDQLIEIVATHPRQAVIIYCLTRAETERLAGVLNDHDVNARPYHAGLDANTRRRTQEAFASERLDVVVATVAFGMGIDRSDVRCVIHAGMPRSVEHYQQETGRAGRDGLEAECVLLYSAADVARWRNLIERGAGDADGAVDVSPQLELLRQMPDCGACDVCLGETEPLPDSTKTAQMILSCVARLDQRFGVGTVVQVLRGAETEATMRRGHDRLSTFGLLRDVPEKVLTNLVYQLVDQDLLERSEGDRPIVRLTEPALDVLRGEREVRLLAPKRAKSAAATRPGDGWEGVDRGLFEHLRDLRRELARDRGVPAYVIFSDRTLRSMARERPADLEALASVHGVGRKKLDDLGPRFVEAIAAYGSESGARTDAC